MVSPFRTSCGVTLGGLRTCALMSSTTKRRDLVVVGGGRPRWLSHPGDAYARPAGMSRSDTPRSAARACRADERGPGGVRGRQEEFRLSQPLAQRAVHSPHSPQEPRLPPVKFQ